MNKKHNLSKSAQLFMIFACAGMGGLVGYDIGTTESDKEIENLNGKLYGYQSMYEDYKMEIDDLKLQLNNMSIEKNTKIASRKLNNDEFCEANKNTRDKSFQKIVRSVCIFN